MQQEKKISISVKNEKLETVLRMVEKQTNYLFFYDSDEINKQQRITINQTNSSLKDVLDAVASKITCHIPLMTVIHFG